MKKKSLLVLMSLMLTFALAGCGKKEETTETVTETTETTTEEEISEEKLPSGEEIQNICKLATLECYYNNVASSTKSAGTGIMHIGEKERKFWIEYTGVATIGIDVSKVKITVEGKNVTVSVPDAELQGELKVISSELSSENYVQTEDGFFNENKITAEDQTAAIAVAQEEMKKQVLEDTELMTRAKDRAKNLIRNYIEQLGEAAGVTYEITFVDVI